MKIRLNEIEVKHALRMGRLYDRKSDAAYAQHNHISGEYWGKMAIAAYTRAEKLSEADDNAEKNDNEKI